MSIEEFEIEYDKIIKRLNEMQTEYRRMNTHDRGTLNRFKREIRRLYLRYCQLYVTLDKPPKSDESWNYDNTCYFYALNLPTPNIFIEVYHRFKPYYFPINVGNLSFLCSEDDEDESLKAFLEYLDGDLEALNIQSYPSTINSPTTHGGFKIAVFYDYLSGDYHFIRQNDDGLWSQKMGLEDTIIISDDPLSFLNESPSGAKSNYEYIKTLEIVKPKKCQII